MRWSGLAGLALLLASCATIIPPGQAQDGDWTAGPPSSVPPPVSTPTARPSSAPAPAPSQPSPIGTGSVGTVFQPAGSDRLVRIGTDPERAVGAGVAPGPVLNAGLFDAAKAVRALAAFRLSCPSLVRREDLSGLVPAANWQAPCDAAANWPDRQAAEFFASQLESLQVGNGGAFATGYFEPQIAGSRTRGGPYQTPVYGKPGDLIEADLGLFAEEWKGKKIRGQVKDGQLVLYDDRTAIEQGSLSARAPVLAWAADPVDLFFLQIQGSGRLALPDGSVMRVGYASQNGRDYTGIGRLMRERGLLEPGQATMQGIKAWLRANPVEGAALMRENESFVFFTELTGPGPLGAMGYPVTAQTTVAADKRFVPLGAPVWLDMEHDIADGLWVVQDTGGAIKGANRFDTFWGAGERAAEIAGGMSSNGVALILVPRGTYARLAGEAGR